MGGSASHRKRVNGSKRVDRAKIGKSGNFPLAILQSRVKDKRVEAEFNDDNSPLFRSACFRHFADNFPPYIGANKD